MCGIVGAIAQRDVVPILIEGLKRLEYRGYDSAGVAVVVPEALAVQAGLSGGDPAEVEMAGGRLIVRPAGPATLSELLAGITPENLHGEWAAGAPAGAELL